MIIIISILAFLFTILGGLFALKFKDKLHLILGFSAGAVIGVAFFDLIPEAIELSSGSYDISTVTSITAIGFILYMVLDRLIILHSHHEDSGEENSTHNHNSRGVLGALSLSTHSFLDGMAIGLAFHVSNTAGIVVTMAVLAHDFSDGINTVNMIIKSNGEKKDAIKWLLVDSVAPVLGILSTLFFTIPQNILGLALSLFAGFFLYIGASDLLPESHHNHPTIWTTVLTIVGIVVIYTAINLAGI